MSDFIEILGFENKSLISDLRRVAITKDFSKNSEILYEGSEVNVVPVVLSGTLKVTVNYKDKELLLYYVNPSESCIMTYLSVLKGEESRINAIAEKDSKVLFIPASDLKKLLVEYFELQNLFYDLFNSRYVDMIDTLKQALFEKLDKRILDYLNKKSKVVGSNSIEVTHQEIAIDLGTAREVVSRVLKRLESENLLSQEKNKIILS